MHRALLGRAGVRWPLAQTREDVAFRAVAAGFIIAVSILFALSEHVGARNGKQWVDAAMLILEAGGVDGRLIPLTQEPA